MPRHDGEIQLDVDLNADDVRDTASKLSNDLERLFNSVKGNKLDNNFRSILLSMRKAIETSDELQNRMQYLETISVPTETYKELGEQLNRLLTRYDALQDRMQKFQDLGGDTKSRVFQSMEYDAARLRNQIVELRFDIDQLNSEGDAFIPGVDTAEYEQLTQELNEVNNQMIILKQRSSDVATIKSFERRVVERLVKLWLSYSKVVAKAVIETGKLFSKLGKIAGNAIISGIKRLGKSIASLGKNSDSVSDKFEHGFKTFIKYAFGVRSFFFLFKKIRKAVAEGFENLAQVHQPFNQAISNILSALNLLKNSLAATFAPIIETVEPILTRLITRVAEVVSTIGQFIAAITGKEFVRAGLVQTDYAHSAEDIAKAEKQAAKEQEKAAKADAKRRKKLEELKKTIAGFDDVEILKGPDKDTDSDTTSPSSDITAAPDFSFSTAPIESAISDFAKRILDAWRTADFYEIGKIVGQKIRDALNRIPWDNIKTTLRKIAKSIATFLNGFLEVPGLFDAIGKTIAEAINSAFEFVESFVSNFHWSSLGNAIKDLIISTLTNIDWPLIYQTFAELGAGIGETLNTVITDPALWTTLFTSAGYLLGAVLSGFDNFLQNVDFGLTGSAIGEGLNNAILTFPWTRISQTLIDLINGAFDLWYNFVTTFDFYKFGAHIGTTLSEVINGIDWKEGAASVAETMNGLLEALNGFMENTNFGQIGHKVVEAIGSFLNTFDWKELGEFLHNCLQSLHDFFIGIYEEIDWDELPDKILTKISEFMEGFNWEDTVRLIMDMFGTAFQLRINLLSTAGQMLPTLGLGIIKGIYIGILEPMQRVGKWIAEHIFDPFKAGFDTSFGVQGDSASEMEDSGKTIPTGVYNGIDSEWSSVGDYFSDNMSDLTDPFDNQDWDGIGTNVVAGIEGGMNSQESSLGITAWNLAVSAYNSMVAALDIGSPSKLFRDKIGKMIPAGLALGILDNAGLVDNAVTDLTDTVTDAGKKALEIPAVVKGGVVPYQATVSSQTESALENIVDALETSVVDRLTGEDLQDILIDVIQTYLNISFYLGDEQIARHANSGNLKLGRRYNTIRTGEA